jgi:putative transposase
MTTPVETISRIRTLREQFPHYGKEKLRVLLREEGITVSPSTIRKVIERWNLPRAPRMYVARRKRKVKPRLPKDSAAQKPGELVSMDTIVLQEHGEKRFIVTALDHATRMALARVYGRLSSRSARDLLQRMQLALDSPSVLSSRTTERSSVQCTSRPVKRSRQRTTGRTRGVRR